jgi:hypothetical protein
LFRDIGSPWRKQRRARTREPDELGGESGGQGRHGSKHALFSGTISFMDIFKR